MQKKVILVDSDVISHFMAANKIDDLPRILAPHHLLIVDQVYRESSYHPFFEDRKEELDNWIRRCHIMRIPFPDCNQDIRVEYYKIKKENPRFGAGERACMAIAKYGKQVIASSNFRDVADYCNANGIEYIGLMDILKIATRKEIYTIEICNQFIYDIKIINDAKLPVYDITKYIPDRNLDEY